MFNVDNILDVLQLQVVIYLLLKNLIGTAKGFMRFEVVINSSGVETFYLEQAGNYHFLG